MSILTLHILPPSTIISELFYFLFVWLFQSFNNSWNFQIPSCWNNWIKFSALWPHFKIYFHYLSKCYNVLFQLFFPCHHFVWSYCFVLFLLVQYVIRQLGENVYGRTELWSYYSGFIIQGVPSFAVTMKNSRYGLSLSWAGLGKLSDSVDLTFLGDALTFRSCTLLLQWFLGLLPQLAPTLFYIFSLSLPRLLLLIP